MDKFVEILMLVLGFVMLIVLLGAITGVFVMLLWNWLMPVLFGLQEITWLQAWGLTALCGFLFKSSNTTSNKS